MDKIAAGLERDGILTGAGGKRWHTSTINKILRNEKCIGDLLEVYLLYGIQSNELDIQIYYRSQNLLVHAVQQ